MKFYILILLVIAFSTSQVFALNPPVLSGASNQYCNHDQGIGLNIQYSSGTGNHIQKMVDNSGTWFNLAGPNYNYTAYNDYAFTTTAFTQLCGHTYSYRAAADQGTTESLWSNVLSITASFSPQNYSIQLSEPVHLSDSISNSKQVINTGVTLTGILTSDQIGLTWTDSQPNVGWAVMRQTDNGVWQNISGDGCCEAIASGPPLGYNDASIVTGQIYKYQVFTTGVNPQVSSNIVTLNTTGWVSSYNYKCQLNCINVTNINVNNQSPQNDSAVVLHRIAGSRMGGAELDAQFLSVNTPRPIGQLTIAGTPGNGLWQTMLRTGDGKTFTCICFGVDGLDGIWHPRAGIIESQNGTLQIVHYAENGHGGNWITNTIYFDANGNLILNKPPYVRDGGMIKQEVFGSDGVVHWVQANPSITNCATQSNCK